MTERYTEAIAWKNMALKKHRGSNDPFRPASVNFISKVHLVQVACHVIRLMIVSESRAHLQRS